MDLKEQILAILAHPEAEDGLYLNNFIALHEEDERDAVDATEKELLSALEELIADGEVVMEATPDGKIFRLPM